jgi:hypothetical protein
LLAPVIRNLSRSRLNAGSSLLWRVSSRPVRSRLKPAGFILPCQPALADRPPAGPGWLHEIKFDGYRVARKDGERVLGAVSTQVTLCAVAELGNGEHGR